MRRIPEIQRIPMNPPDDPDNVGIAPVVVRKLSDLTGNPWDDLSGKEQGEVLMLASQKTYEAWMKPPPPTLGEVYARFCGNKVREWDAYCNLRAQAEAEMNAR